MAVGLVEFLCPTGPFAARVLGTMAKAATHPGRDNDPGARSTRPARTLLRHAETDSDSGGAVKLAQRPRISWGARCQFFEGKGLQQILPRIEDQIRGDRRKIVEETAAGPELFPSRAPECVSDIAHRMEGEGKKVQGNEDRGEVLLAVTEVMFKMIAAGF